MVIMRPYDYIGIAGSGAGPGNHPHYVVSHNAVTCEHMFGICAVERHQTGFPELPDNPESGFRPSSRACRPAFANAVGEEFHLPFQFIPPDQIMCSRIVRYPEILAMKTYVRS